MHGRNVRRTTIGALGAVLGLGFFSLASAATKAINLDGLTANGAESAVSLNILNSFPAKVEDRVTNRSVGKAYTFRWPSAGPGGFSSQLGTGTIPGVGVVWVWQTAQTIFSFTGSSCANDICFTAVPAPGPSNTPPWAVPGRTLAPNSVTLSSGSLTSSLLSFFSPDNPLVSVTSSVQQLPSGAFSYQTTYTNSTNTPIDIHVPAAPVGCCEESCQLNCDGECVDALFDEDNCGACGAACNEETCYDCGEYFGGGESGATCDWGFCCCDYGGKYESTARDGRGARAGAQGLTGPRGLAGPRPAVAAGSFGKCFFDDAPICETQPYTKTITEPGSETVCETHAYLPKEIPGLFTVCGLGIPDGEPTCNGTDPASEGPFMQLVPDFWNPVPASGAYLTVAAVSLTETTGNGNGILQPGETGNLLISVRNSAPTTYVDPAADLLSPPVDLNGDAADDLVLISQTVSPTPYSPDVQGLVPGSGDDCHGPFAPENLSTNTFAFVVQVPPNHPGDVNRPFTLEFVGTVDAEPTPISVALNLGIGSAEANLKITKLGTPSPVVAGGNITYTLGVSNQGPLTATNVVVTDVIPAGTTFVSKSAPAGWTCTAPAPGYGGTLTCQKATLDSGGSATISLVVKATLCSSATSVSNTATVSSDTPDEHTEDNSVTISTPIANATPVVDITSPATDQTAVTNLNYPVTVRFRSQAPAPIARETVSLDNCLLWDGATYGDRDGLLTDEYALQTTKAVLCQAMARCGLTVMYYPRIKVAATDTCGRTGRDEVIFRKNLLRSEVCPPR